MASFGEVPVDRLDEMLEADYDRTMWEPGGTR
jgi:hypothetical protein